MSTITEDGNVLNHEEYGIISVHIGIKNKINIKLD